MHAVLLCIGSNTYAKRNIVKAKQKLDVVFPNIKYTPVCESNPYGLKYKRYFLNLLASFSTEKNPNEICLKMKQIESEMGRKTDDKSKGRVIIDIDLVRYDNEVLKPKDFERSYVQDLLVFFEL